MGVVDDDGQFNKDVLKPQTALLKTFFFLDRLATLFLIRRIKYQNLMIFYFLFKYLSVLNLFSLNAVINAGDSRKAFRLKLP